MTIEQERAIENYYRWYHYLQELENDPSTERNAEWRFATTAEQEWASAVRRAGLPFPPEHLQLRYVA